MFGPTPNSKLQRRIELAIRVAAPALDLLLVLGDGVSRVLHPGNRGYSLARVPHEGDAAPRGLRGSSSQATRTTAERG